MKQKKLIKISFMVSPEEKRRILEKAEIESLALASFCRNAIIQKIKSSGLGNEIL